MRTVVALGHHYYRFVTTSTMAGLILAAPALVLMFAAVMASRWIRSRGRLP